MRGFIFFLFLCFLLLKGYGYVYTGIHAHGLGYSSNKTIEKINRLKFTKPGQDYSFIDDNSTQKEKACICSGDIEDEGDDDDDVFPKKLKWLTGRPTAPPDPFIVSYLYSCPTHRPTSGRHLSDKYILQRTLRI
jgi:hypothetical protein